MNINVDKPEILRGNIDMSGNFPDTAYVTNWLKDHPNGEVVCRDDIHNLWYRWSKSNNFWVPVSPELLKQQLNPNSAESDIASDLKNLGSKDTKYKYDYDPDVLETFENRDQGEDYVVTFDAYEFTSLCVTGDTMIGRYDEASKQIVPTPIKELVGTEGKVVGFDTTTYKMNPYRYSDVRCTQRDVPIHCVMFESCTKSLPENDPKKYSIHTIKCTPNHQFLVRTYSSKDGHVQFDWVESQRLELNTELVGKFSFDEENYQTHKVIGIRYAGRADVYNMEVENVENYLANDVIIHNCPKTGQPDLAKVVISYVPNKKMVESKSLKLYLFSFRNHGAFHETCMNMIADDLYNLMEPKYLEVRGIFAPRGGISIFPQATRVNPEFPEYNKFKEQRMLDALRDGSNRTIRYDM